jgi:hypothetical protein
LYALKYIILSLGAQAAAPVPTTQSVVTTHSPSTGSCVDAISDCADYGDNVCTAYGDWAQKNCQKHCKFCQGKRFFFILFIKWIIGQLGLVNRQATG